jgi:hypothetical protein
MYDTAGLPPNSQGNLCCAQFDNQSRFSKFELVQISHIVQAILCPVIPWVKSHHRKFALLRKYIPSLGYRRPYKSIHNRRSREYFQGSYGSDQVRLLISFCSHLYMQLPNLTNTYIFLCQIAPLFGIISQFKWMYNDLQNNSLWWSWNLLLNKHIHNHVFLKLLLQ